MGGDKGKRSVSIGEKKKISPQNKGGASLSRAIFERLVLEGKKGFVLFTAREPNVGRRSWRISLRDRGGRGSETGISALELP